MYVPEKNVFKYPAFFILWRKHNLDRLCWARYVSLCSIYWPLFLLPKSSHRFLLISVSVTEDISSIMFQCSALYRTDFNFLWLFIHLLPRKWPVFKYPVFFYPLKEPQFGEALLGRYVSLCSIYWPLFHLPKSSHRFLLMFVSVIEDIVLIEIMK